MESTQRGSKFLQFSAIDQHAKVHRDKAGFLKGAG
jgi:hypothetical protein